ncbi:MAG TPA: bifunctional demethylmenaquinone methyltransferase/2-methoxy-6-polyprenyl-1,4-benzoquinol methylase UbiE [Bryobacteraceae bacterium]|jgi:demethylmenaquinone methyltransferase/2-methoxy-6-polyprenyl-1,4-benzoquinol methylase|nr:bifunctional demethylmenaquinone methyltransferase/2-methoxy-6-polyprenyl-1,4-benzoquinol methylase UbiE [Bryobacteraceae bacterium]
MPGVMKPAGATPEGARSEQEAARQVRAMFGRVAPRYDLANHLLSANIDKYWRNRTVSRVADILARPDARVVDLACGTGDLLIALERKAGRGLIGSDFCYPMLAGARGKLTRDRLRSTLVESDALALPFPARSVDLITIAFGFRNLANYRDGLIEMRRVLRPGGALAILEFSQPPNALFATVYNWYSRRILPIIGGAISGVKDAYEYLPESVRKFPDAPELARMMEESGFDKVDWEYLTFGIAALHIGRINP